MFGLKNTIGAELAPVLAPLVDDFNKFLKENHAAIAGKIRMSVERLANSLRETDWKAVGARIEGMWEKIEKVVDAIGGWSNAFLGLAVIMNANVILAVVNITIAIAKLTPIIWAAGEALLALAVANPVVLAIAVVVGASGSRPTSFMRHGTRLKPGGRICGTPCKGWLRTASRKSSRQ